MAFYGASKEEVKNELTAAIKNSTLFSQLVDDIRAGVVDLR